MMMELDFYVEAETCEVEINDISSSFLTIGDETFIPSLNRV